MDKWNLNDEVRAKFKPILTEYLHKVETVTAEEMEHMENEELGLELTDTGISPWQLKELLEELGYEARNSDDNGWELDFWIYMRRIDGKTFESSCEELTIRGCGMTFELRLYIEDMDF